MGSYPILQGEARRSQGPYPRSVQWDLVKDHECQAQSNHSQSLARLAERGGLSPKELWCIVHDKKYYDPASQEMTEAKVMEWLHSLGDLVSW